VLWISGFGVETKSSFPTCRCFLGPPAGPARTPAGESAGPVKDQTGTACAQGAPGGLFTSLTAGQEVEIREMRRPASRVETTT